MFKVPARVLEIVEGAVLAYFMLGAFVGLIYSFWGVPPMFILTVMATIILWIQCVSRRVKVDAGQALEAATESGKRSDVEFTEILSLLGTAALATIIGILVCMALRWVVHQPLFWVLTVVVFAVTVVVFVTKR